MRFPQDIFTMIPASNDLWACVVKSTEILRTKSIVGVPNVYTPLSVVIFNLLAGFNFDTVRLGSFIVTGVCAFIVICVFPRSFGGCFIKSRLGLVLAALSFMGYGLRFELERGQMNGLVLCLSLLAIILSRKGTWITALIAFMLITFTFQMKVWPLIFIACLYQNTKTFLSNFLRFSLFGLINAALFFCLGIDFFKQYLAILMQSAQSEVNIWVANMSVYAYKMQLVKYYQVPNVLLYIGGLTITLIFLGTLLRTMFLKSIDHGALQIYLCTLGGLLFPNISYDYKLSIFYIVTIFFYTCYRPIYANQSLLRNINIKGGISISFKRSVLAERICLLLPIVLYPMTLFSYFYKSDFGFLLTSNTTPLIIILIALVTLVWIQPTKSLGSLRDVS